MLADPAVELLARHVRLDPAVTRRAAVVQRQFARDHVRNDIRLSHSEPAHRIGSDLFFVFIILLARIESILEMIRAIENEIFVVELVHDVGRRVPG